MTGKYAAGTDVPPDVDHERAFGDYTPCRYAWLLADVEPLEVPVPAKGRQGLWEWAGP